MNSIAFPRLGLKFDIDPVAIPFGGGGVRWYGIIIASGVVLALLLCSALFRRRGLDPELLADFMIWALPIGIIGARAYYVFFSWDYYRDNPAEIVRIWEGGIAVYGGIIAGLAVALVFCRVKGISFLRFADLCAPGVALGQCIGRWGNFVNGEAHGGETGLPWGMSINGSAPVHPTFLYESLWSLAGLALLLAVLRLSKSSAPGFAFFSYLAWYGAGRFFIEGLRTDSLYTASGLRASQIVAVICVAVGAAGIAATAVRSRREREKCSEEREENEKC